MKPTRIITVCLMSFLCGMAWLTFAAPPKLPRKPAATETKGATLLMQSQAAFVAPPAVKSVPIKWPTMTRNYRYELFRNGVSQGFVDEDIITVTNRGEAMVQYRVKAHSIFTDKERAFYAALGRTL